eukprot:6116920-Pyramimonas_sp.AAC.1
MRVRNVLEHACYYSPRGRTACRYGGPYRPPPPAARRDSASPPPRCTPLSSPGWSGTRAPKGRPSSASLASSGAPPAPSASSLAAS